MSDSKLPGLCESLGIKLAATHVRLNLDKKGKAFPTDKDQGWAHDEFSVSLYYSDKVFDSSYKMGLGHRKLVSGATKERGGYFWGAEFKSEEEALKCGWLVVVPPTVADAMYCLLNDASGAEESFKNWCGDFGYSDDSIKAWENYRACQETRDALIRMFGKEIFEQLVEACQNY